MMSVCADSMGSARSLEKLPGCGQMISYYLQGRVLSQDLETGCPKLTIVKLWGTFERYSTVLRGTENINTIQTQNSATVGKG